MKDIDESMREQEYINRFLNMIANEYDGTIAREFQIYYIKKDKEIKRLNNIIDELEKDMRETMEILKTTEYQKIDIDYVIETLDIYCNRLKELREGKK